jgi:hypothetical protein
MLVVDLLLFFLRFSPLLASWKKKFSFFRSPFFIVFFFVLFCFVSFCCQANVKECSSDCFRGRRPDAAAVEKSKREREREREI